MEPSPPMRNAPSAGVVLLPGDEIRHLHHLEIAGDSVTLSLWGGRVITVTGCPPGFAQAAKRSYDAGMIARIDLRGTPWLKV